MASKSDSCSIREPYPATKEKLVQRTRAMAQMTNSDPQVKEIYYSFNPTAPSFVPRSQNTESSATRTSERQTPVPSQALRPSTNLNPDSKPFIPTESFISRPTTTGLNIMAPVFHLGPRQEESPAAPRQGTNKDEALLSRVHDLFQTDPSHLEELIAALAVKLHHDNATVVVELLMDYGVCMDWYYYAAKIIASLIEKKDFMRILIFKNLQSMIQQSEGLKPVEIVPLTWFVSEVLMKVLMKNQQHFVPMRLALLDLLTRMLEAPPDDAIVHESCGILKLTGKVLEGNIDDEYKQRRDEGLAKIFSMLHKCSNSAGLDRRSHHLIANVIQLRSARWQMQTPQPTEAAVPIRTTTDEDGTVHYHYAKAPPPANDTTSTANVDWREYLDDKGKPYTEQLDSDDSFVEQLDIESEFEQFVHEEMEQHIYKLVDDEEEDNAGSKPSSKSLQS